MLFLIFSPKTAFQVETDKGFNFSLVDDSFVCQKKNHFQVTVTVVFHRIPKFLKLKVASKLPVRNVLTLNNQLFLVLTMYRMARFSLLSDLYWISME
jgi:hypothetical protein